MVWEADRPAELIEPIDRLIQALECRRAAGVARPVARADPRSVRAPTAPTRQRDPGDRGGLARRPPREADPGARDRSPRAARRSRTRAGSSSRRGRSGRGAAWRSCSRARGRRRPACSGSSPSCSRRSAGRSRNSSGSSCRGAARPGPAHLPAAGLRRRTRGRKRGEP